LGIPQSARVLANQTPDVGRVRPKRVRRKGDSNKVHCRRKSIYEINGLRIIFLVTKHHVTYIYEGDEIKPRALFTAALNRGK
jgi:hypothetical protein